MKCSYERYPREPSEVLLNRRQFATVFRFARALAAASLATEMGAPESLAALALEASQSVAPSAPMPWPVPASPAGAPGDVAM
jgi:hypothetical protein